MKRSIDSNDSSLELLLDTICNTFGGILFISVLVVILLNLSGQQSTETPVNEELHHELMESRIRLAQAKESLSQLRSALEVQAKIESQIVDPDLRDKIKKLRDLQQKNAGLINENTEGLDEIGASQANVNEINNELVRLDDDLR
ncbi:hypothetical protein ACFL2H_03740, partial [Planctomycetota bacterium]